MSLFHFSTFVLLLKKSYQGWRKDNASVWSSSLAYFAVFSFAPLLYLSITLSGFFISRTLIEENMYAQVEGLLGASGAETFFTIVRHTQQQSLYAPRTLISAAVLLIAAIEVFLQLQLMLNTIWNVKAKPKNGILGFLWNRFVNFLMIGIVACVLLISLIASTVIGALGTYFGQQLPTSATLLEILNFVLSFCTISVLFAVIFKFLPDVKIPWKNVWGGAVLTSFLFTLGKAVIGIYIGYSGVTSQYGAVASLIILLLWVYYSAQILFFGAEFTKAYTLMKHQKIRPNKFSVKENTSL